MSLTRKHTVYKQIGAVATFICLWSFQLIAATPCCDGTLWLKTSQEARTAYVDGYIDGLLRGFGRGCLTGTKGMQATEPGPDADPFHKCLLGNFSFSRTSGEYAKLITEFYERFPDDRDVRVLEVLIKLSQGLSLEQLHQQRKGHTGGAASNDGGLPSQMSVPASSKPKP
jgi:hypothetical protein